MPSHRRRFIVPATLLLLTLAEVSQAQVVRTWDGEDSTNFFDVGDNWSGNVTPGPLDTARFTTPFDGAYSVLWDNFSGDRTTATLEVLAGNVTFRRDSGDPRTYAMTTATINAGRLQLSDLRLSLAGMMTINNGGRVDVNASGKLSGAAASSLILGSAGGGTLELHGDALINVGSVTVAAGGQFNLASGKLVANSITAASGFNFTGGTLATSNFTGALTQSGGILSPGDAGTRAGMIIAQGYTMSGGVFEAELFASNSDQLIVGGPISIAGALNLTNVSSPTTLGTSRILVDGSSLTGQFGSVTGVALSTARYAAVTYTSSQALLTIALPGDATLSDGVGFQDLVALAQNYNLPNRTWATGDFNGSGVTNFADLVLLAQNYGVGAVASVPDGASSDFAADWALAQSLVPEPITLSLMPAVLAIGRRRRG